MLRIKRQQGVTLLELMVVIAIISILIVSVAPSFQNLMINTQREEVVTGLISALSYARSEAIRRGTEVDVSPTQASYSEGLWQVQDQSAPPVVIRVFEVSDRMSIRANEANDDFANNITFDGRGWLDSLTISLNVCPKDADEDMAGSRIQVELIGRPRSTEICCLEGGGVANGTCP